MAGTGTGIKPWDQRIAERAARMLARAPWITPNMVTLFGLCLGIGTGIVFAQGGWAMHVAAFLFMCGVLNDHIDGSLARLTGRTSEFGHHFDNVACGVTYTAMFVGAGFGLSKGWMGGWAIAAGIVAGIAVTAIFLSRVVAEQKAGSAAIRQPSFAGFEIEDILYVVGPITWLGLLGEFILAAAIGAPLFLTWVVIDALRKIRAQKKVPAP
ncbi:MAG: CDP-alcohol phosphatidyltransferase family protein [Alphaproteobacteria bacterium]